MEQKNHINNERGVSLLPTMVILMIGTLIGLAATSTSMFEVQISTNDKIYKQNFFRADGTNQQGAQLIENATNDDLKNRSADWLTFNDSSIDYLDEANWCTPAMFAAGDCTGNINSIAGSIPNTKLMVVDQGGAPGTEISMGSDMMHAMSVYSRYDSTNPRGRVIIETEYRKRF
jgi:Tfp pilus assembly protein PilX